MTIWLRSESGCRQCLGAGANTYAVPGNYPRLKQFRDAIQAQWLSVLRRRSQRGRRLTWDKFSKLPKRWLPTPKILHPYPNARFASQHARYEPYAVVPHVRICAGAVSNDRPYRDNLRCKFSRNDSWNLWLLLTIAHV